MRLRESKLRAIIRNILSEAPVIVRLVEGNHAIMYAHGYEDARDDLPQNSDDPWYTAGYADFLDGIHDQYEALHQDGVTDQTPIINEDKETRILGKVRLQDPSKPHSYVRNPRNVYPKKYEYEPRGPSFSELPTYAKNRQVNIYDDLMQDENEVLRNDVFDLIDKSYAYIGGNADIRTAYDLKNPKKNDYVDFLAWDIDDDPEPDVLRGMKPKAGYTKLSLSATDMSKAAGEYSANDTALRLRDGKHYAEMSGKAATVQMRVGTPAVTNPQTVASLLPGKAFTFFGKHPVKYSGSDPEKQKIAAMFKDNRGSHIEAKKAAEYGPDGQYDGWYVRMLGGTPHAKLIFGKIG